MNSQDKKQEIVNDLEHITNSLKMFHFSTELEFNEKKNIPSDDNENNNTKNELRIEKLENIISTLKNKSNNLNLVKDSKKDFFTKVDNAVFKQQWKRLSPFHRSIKLKEFVNDICSKINNEPAKLTALDTMLSKSTELTEKFVKYDYVNSKILEITLLSFDDKTLTWKIKSHKKETIKII